MFLSRILLAGRFPTLVSFFSVAYMFLFLPVTLVLYTLTPRCMKRYALLIVSYAFCWLIGGTLIAYLWLTTLSVYLFGLWLGKLISKRDAELAGAAREQKKAIRSQWQRRMRRVIALASLVHIGALVACKYAGFLLGNVNDLLGLLGSGFRFSVPRLAQPLGTSFFTLQALSYILDVYRGTIPADHRIDRVALFMGFFPQIVEGPICRYAQTAQPLYDAGPIRRENLKLGLQRLLFGLMKKLVVADRLDSMVSAIFKNPGDFSGGLIALAAVGYTVELYMDFSGAMDAVCGTAQIFGVAMPENFSRPFFARTISEFWQRWHITLGAWLRDYLFYPVSTSKPMKALTLKARRKLGPHYGPLLAGGIALLCVWLCNGLWHGAGWNYVFFGLYHFVLILGGSLISPLTRPLYEKLRINPDSAPCRVLQTLRTAVLVVLGEVFFRADSVGKGFMMIGRMFGDFRFPASWEGYGKTLRIDGSDLLISLVTVLIVLVIGLVKERGIGVRSWLEKRRTLARWALIYALILFIVIFGAYGHGYMPVNPMYANF